jgi:hypothetical protein
MANQITEEQQRKIEALERSKRKGERQAAQSVVAAKTQLKKAMKRARQPLSFASAITRHVNSGGPSLRPGQFVDLSSDE